MKASLLGVETFNYIQKSTGKEASVCILHVMHPKNRVNGFAVEQVRIYEGSDCFNKCTQLEPRSYISIDLDSRGYVTDIDLLQSTSSSYASQAASEIEAGTASSATPPACEPPQNLPESTPGKSKK